MSTLGAKIRSLLSGMVLGVVLFSVMIPFSTAVPTKDVTIEVKVKRVLNTTTSTGNTNSTVENSSVLEELRVSNKRYLVKQNDEIALEIYLINPSQQKIISTETWLSYDPKKLTGVKLDNSDSKFDLITPGENEFVAEQSLVRIGRGNTTGGIDGTRIKVAAVHFKVISGKAGDSSDVKFYDFQANELGHTNVNIISGGLPFNVLSGKAPEPVRLYMNSNAVPPATTNPPTNNQPSYPTYQPPLNTGTGAVYPAAGTGLLPVPTNLRATTNSSSITLSWEPVLDGRVKYYYVYYTKHRNLYLHRKRVYGTGTTFTNLQAGDRYYFVVTAADESDNESGYSPEVSITVGQNYSIAVTTELTTAAIESLNKLSRTPGTGPKEDMMLLLALISCLVYPTYKVVRRYSGI